MDELPKRVAIAWTCFALGVLAALALLKVIASRVYAPPDEG